MFSMRGFRWVFGLFLLTFFPSILWGRALSFKFEFPPPQIEEEGEFHLLSFWGCRSIASKPGDPIMPVKAVNFLLPCGEMIRKIEIKVGEEVILPGFHKLKPGDLKVPIGSAEPFSAPSPNPVIYGTDEPYPGRRDKLIAIQSLYGFKIALLNLFPVKYLPVSGRLSYFPKIEMEVYTEPSLQFLSSTARMVRTDPFALRRVKTLVENPGLIKGYLQLMDGQRSLDPTESYPYLILTNGTLAPYFEPLALFKTQRGIRTKVVTLDQVSSYPGDDLQEKIRNFVNYAYTNWGTTYLLLGGDDEIIPHRGFYDMVNEGYPGYEEVDYDIPADLYYGGLDGNWNTDGDDKWGEPEEDDLLAEVIVGRAAVDSPTEAENFVRKVISYEENPVVADCNQALMVGEDLYWTVWGKDYKEEIRNGSSNWGYTTVGFPPECDVNVLYDKDGYWSAMGDLLPLLNGGLNLINHMGHADVTEVMKFDDMDITDVNCTNDGLNHGFYLIYTQGCYCNSFDNRTTSPGVYTRDAISEKFTTIENGAVAFIGNTRYGWGSGYTTDGPSQHYDREFFDAPFGESIYEIGFANQDSKEDNIGFIEEDALRWCYYEINLLGDPLMEIWTAQPGSLIVELPLSHPLGNAQIDVTVQEDSALVAISQNGELYGTAYSCQGVAEVILDPVPSEAGTLTVVVSKHNYLLYREEVEVLPVANVSIEPETLEVNISTEVMVTVLDTADLPIEDVEVEINGWGIKPPYVDTTGSDGVVVAEVRAPYGETLEVKGHRLSESYNLFCDSLYVIGADSLPGVVIWARCDSVGLNDTLAPFYEGKITGTGQKSGFDLLVSGCGLDTSITTQDTLAEIFVTPTESGIIQVVMADTGYLIWEENIPVIDIYGTLSGYVKDGNTQEHLEGVEIAGYESGVDTSLVEPKFLTVSNSNGFYQVTQELPARPYDIYCWEFGYLPYGETEMLKKGVNSYDLLLTPSPPARIWGYVKDKDSGLPLDAKIKLYRYDTKQLYQQVETDTTNGEYELNDLPYFTYKIKVYAYNHISHSEILQLTAGTLRRDFLLQETAGNILVINDDDGSKSGDSRSTGKVERVQYGASAEYMVQYLQGLGFYVVSEEAAQADPANWDEYSLLIWSDGSDVTPVVEEEYRQALIDYVSYQGKLLIEGGELTYDAASYPGYPAFSQNVLHVDSWVADRSGDLTLVDEYSTHPLASSPNAMPSNIQFNFKNYGNQDATLALPDAYVVYDCALEEGKAGILVHEDLSQQPQIVFYSFDLLAIADSTTRSELLENTVHYLLSGGEVMVPQQEMQSTPNRYELAPNYPNPFNPTTSIRYGLPREVMVRLEVFNILGQRVATLVDQVQKPGFYNILWDAAPLSSGIYFYRLDAEEFSQTRKMVLLR
jgi:hypothetical protein